MWGSTGRSGYGDINLDGTYDDVTLGLSPNGRQYRNEATLETRDLSGWAYWNLRKQITPEQEIPESFYARNETEAMSHTLANGQANLAKYADPVAVRKAAPKVSIKDKILPQAKRLTTLRTQMLDLEKAYRAGEMDIKEYSLLREVIVVKINRAEVLYRKAISKAPSYDEEDTAQTWEETHKVSGVYVAKNGDQREGESVSWVEDLPDKNSLKKPLKIACMIVKTAVRWHQAARNYYNELKAI